MTSTVQSLGYYVELTGKHLQTPEEITASIFRVQEVLAVISQKT
jgi:hypothetical protein